MTREEREEAARIIKECKDKGFKHTFYTLNEYHTALDTAIKALEQEPCEDAIRRADAEALFRNARSKLNPSDYKTADEFNTRDLMLLNAEQFIHLLPSVRPQEPKTGHWIIEVWNNKEHHTCSNCQHVVTYEPCYHYCPYCGAKMIEPQEREE